MENKVLIVLLSLGVSLVMHVWLGWAWSIAGPILGGFLIGKGGGRYGAVILAVSWGMLMMWNFWVAGAESLNMMETMGTLLGRMPAAVVPLSVLLLSALLGMSSGALGSALKPRETP